MHRLLLLAVAVPFLVTSCDYVAPTEISSDPTFSITSTSTALPGKIVVNHDEWTLGDPGFANGDADAFALSVASWFTGCELGNFLVYSDDQFFDPAWSGSLLPQTMTAAGHGWVISDPVPITLQELLDYDGVFVAGPFPSATAAPDNQLLIDYVEAGGNIYLAGGTADWPTPAQEAAAWSTFLNHFNLSFGPTWGVVGSLPVTSSHPIFNGVSSLYYVNGNPVSEIDPSDPNTDILESAGSHGLIGVYEWAARLPRSCADIRELDPTAADGEYTIYLNQQVLPVYCHDMAGTPQEYLTLVNTGGSHNFSQYTAGGASPGTSVRTYYQKVRLDLTTLLVHIGDQAFSSSTGLLYHGGGQVTSMPYGVGMACVSPNNPAGVANIDLRGTPFKLADTFYPDGHMPAGSATFSSDDQVVDLTGGGYCGWITPSPYIYNPYNTNGGLQLDLAYIGPPLVEVEIEIKPGSCTNSINLGSNGAIPVAILSSATFDATTVDPTTVALADAAVKVKGKGTPMASVEDVNGDGLDDLIVHVETQGLSLTDGAAQAILTAQTYGGMVIAGVDAVRIVP